jgi:hypothetical protein
MRSWINLIESTQDPLRSFCSVLVEEGQSRYFFVLSKNGYARVINEDDPELIDAWNEGWDTEWDSARSVDQGLKWAAEQKGLTPAPASSEVQAEPAQKSPFWFVFSKDGLARAIPEDEVDLKGMRTEGWTLEYDSARSAEKGLEWARDQKGLKPWDHFLPRVMTEAKPLFRSVSLPELLDIAKTGKIMGGGNVFNEFDPRRYVFFGDQISDELIFQGADTERQAQMLLKDHPIHGRFKALNDKLAAARAQVVQGVREHIWEINQYREDAGHAPLQVDENLLDAFVEGNSSTERQIRELLPHNSKDPIYKMWVSYQKLKDKVNPLQAQYREIFRKTHNAHADKINARPITSAILETKPLTGGLEYSEDAGSLTGMDLPEYGFERGAVTLDDVIKVYWVKDRKIISSGSPDTILPTLREVGLGG